MLKKIISVSSIMILFVVTGCDTNYDIGYTTDADVDHIEEYIAEDIEVEVEANEYDVVEEDVEGDVAEEISIELLEERSHASREFFIINQMNSRRNVLLILPSFITEDSFYIVANHSTRGTSNEIIVFDHEFSYQRTVEVTDRSDVWIESLYVSADAIYFTLVTPIFENYLYRYDIQTGESMQIAGDVISQLIVDDLVFHYQNRPYHGAPLYTLNLVSGERELILSDWMQEFFISIENESVMYIGAFNSIYQADFTGELDDILGENARIIWTFDGERILVSAYENPSELWMINLEAGDQIFIDDDLRRGSEGFFEIGFIEDYIFVVTENFIDVFEPDNPAYRKRLLAADIAYFAVLMDRIAFRLEDSDNLYTVDLAGNMDILFEN